MEKITHLVHVPWTGLGLYNGFRGNGWLKNRIRIFKQFVIPSLLNQVDEEFILWCAWRREELNNPHVGELKEYLDSIGIKNVFTYSGIAFWDDKYSDDIARLRLIDAIHGSVGTLVDYLGECDYVLMTIQPSDDCYDKYAFAETKEEFRKVKSLQVFGYSKGYVMDYQTSEIREWNPNTTPPFYTIKFPRNVFIDPLKHLQFTGPYKSHEYVKDYLNAKYMERRGFLVGTHGDNISTVFKHPFSGDSASQDVLIDFGIDDSGVLVVNKSIRKYIFKRIPHSIQRKMRYWAGEKKWILRPLFNFLYGWIRG